MSNKTPMASRAHTTGKMRTLVDFEKMRGFFEHEIKGDDLGGGLWFEHDENGKVALADYDGVYSLPEEVATSLMALGVVIPDDF